MRPTPAVGFQQLLISALVEAPGFDPLLIISMVLKLIGALFKNRQLTANKGEFANGILKGILFLLYRL